MNYFVYVKTAPTRIAKRPAEPKLTILLRAPLLVVVDVDAGGKVLGMTGFTKDRELPRLVGSPVAVLERDGQVVPARGTGLGMC